MWEGSPPLDALGDVTAAHSGMRPGLIGARAGRVDDEGPLTGTARYLADVRLTGALEVAFIRSHVPHGVITGIDGQAARAAEGVEAVITAADLEGLQAVPDYSEVARPVRVFPLCEDRVRHVGAPVAAVVASDRYLAEDAAELVAVDIEPLPPLGSIDDAVADGAQRLYEDWPDNLQVSFSGSSPETDAAFGRLRTVRSTCTVGRHGAVPLETRGVAARYEDGRLTVWSSTQLPQIARALIATVLGLPERDVRVIVPEVGGGFGGKAEVYREEYVVAWLAMRLGRPVRWIEDRYENLLSMCQSRDVRVELEAAVHDDGTIEALRGALWQDLGSGEMFPYGFVTGVVAIGTLTGAYRIPHQSVDLHCVVTNKAPSGAYRGFGAPEGAFAMERLVDRIAAELQLDALDLRRRMLVEPGDLPYVTATGARLDSGSHREAFDRALAMGRERLAAARKEHADRPHMRVGLGIATLVEGTAASYYLTTGHWTQLEACSLAVDHDGGVTVAVGLSTYGQGTRTMVATLVAELLGVRVEDVRVVIGDTDAAPHGFGSVASRSTVVAAGALTKAAGPLREKATRIAAHLLEAAPEDLETADGRFEVRGSGGKGVSWGEVAEVALARTLDLPEGVDAGLHETATYESPAVEHTVDASGRINASATYNNATHAAVVAVDTETGAVRVTSYAVAHDCGRVINPQIVAGQVHGGVAQGIGGALLEDFVYDSGAQPLSTTFMDYLLPSAVEIPSIALEEMETPAPGTAFGVKGCGEGGTIGPMAAIASAVDDALRDLGAPHVTATPITPESVLELIDAAGAGR